MSDAHSHNEIRRGFKGAEPWAIITVLFAAGLAIGYPVGARVERTAANDRVTELSAAFAQTVNAKDETVRMCLGTSTKAADTAAKAANTAAEAAGTAKEAVERAGELKK